MRIMSSSKGSTKLWLDSGRSRRMEGLASMASMATFAATGTGHSLMGVKLFVSGEKMKKDGEKS